MPPSPEEKLKQLKEYGIQLEVLRKVFPDRVAGTVPGFACPEINITEFQIQQRVGEGGFGVVYSARRNGQVYAIKIQQKERWIGSPLGIERLVAERKILSSMDNPLICKIFGRWQNRSMLYMYLEYAMYGCLSDVCKSHPKLTEDMAINYMSQIVCGLEYVHSCNIIYRDLKPANCLLFDRGRLKLGDFGLAVTAKEGLTGLRGTYKYCAPEMFLGEAYNDAVDWWAAGMSMHQLLYDEFAFGIGDIEDRDSIARKIMGELTFADEPALSREAKDLMTGFLTRIKQDRLGSGPNAATVVKQHAWFKGVDWYDVIFEEPLSEHPHKPIEGTSMTPLEHLLMEDITRSDTSFGDAFKEF